MISDFLKEGPVDQSRSANPTGNGQLAPADRARQLGLQSNGKGGYIDPNTGQVVARTVNNELVFYSSAPGGGAVSDGSGGSAVANPSTSWQDPISGLMTTPPGQPESPNELAAVPDPVPAQAPAGYNAFINQKKHDTYIKDKQAREQPQPPPEMDPDAEVTPDQAMAEPQAVPGMTMGENYLGSDLLKRTGGMGPPTFSDLQDRLKRSQIGQQQVTPPDAGEGGGQVRPPAPTPTQYHQSPQYTPEPDEAPSQTDTPVLDSFRAHRGFTQGNVRSNEDWVGGLGDNANSNQFQDLRQLVPDFQGTNPKYLDLLSRGLVTRKNADTRDWNFFADGQGGGAGENASRFGEIMSMVLSTASPEEVEALVPAIRQQLEGDSDSYIDPSWLDAAVNNRQGVANMLKFENPDAEEAPTPVAGAWDVKDELEAFGIGTEDGEKKGFSTDEVIRDSNGRNYQTSLKKDGRVMLLNSSAGYFPQMMLNGIRSNPAHPLHDELSQYFEENDEINKIQEKLGRGRFEDTMGATPTLREIEEKMDVDREEARKIRDRWTDFRDQHQEVLGRDGLIDDAISANRFNTDQNDSLLQGLQDHLEEISGMDESSWGREIQEILTEEFEDLGVPEDMMDRFFDDRGKLRTNPRAARRGHDADMYARAKQRYQEVKEQGDEKKELQNAMKKARRVLGDDVDLPSIVEAMKEGRIPGMDQRAFNKLAYNMLLRTGDGRGIKAGAKARNDNFRKAALDAVGNNVDLRKGLLESIREVFPLKDVAQGNEHMVIGENALTANVLANPGMFGTRDYNQIQDRLRVVTPEEEGKNPYIAYQAAVDPMNMGEPHEIPIADVNIRQDGVGYGNTIKSELQLRDDFYRKLSEINQQMGGGLTAEEVVAEIVHDTKKGLTYKAFLS